MDSILEHTPASFQIYLDQFKSDPDKTIAKLEQHVIKRNTGAVGYFFLAWLSHKNGDKTKAIEHAWTAKVYAPGSPLMERLHYFLAHPDSFDAWVPDKKIKNYKKEHNSGDRSHPISDLDSLITKLSAVETKRIKLSEEDLKKEVDEDLSKHSTQVDDIVTETLAGIHEKQKNYEAAIETYKQLRRSNPTKREHFDEQIFRLQQLKDSNT